MSVLKNLTTATIQAAEISIDKNDCVVPSKLKMLGNAGWAIVDAHSDSKGGFTLLLTRPGEPEPKEVARPLDYEVPKAPAFVSWITMDNIKYRVDHVGKKDCPNKCDCRISAVEDRDTICEG